MSAVLSAGRVLLGRRPEQVLWTPSKPLPWWYGNWGTGRFTADQQTAMAAHGIPLDTTEVMEVRREADPVSGDPWTLRERLPVYAFECPVVGLREDRVVVIGPNGKPKAVRQDGWAHKPTDRIIFDAWSLAR